MPNIIAGLVLAGIGLTFAVFGLTMLWPPFGVWLFGLWP